MLYQVEAKINLSQLMLQLESDETIHLTRHGFYLSHQQNFYVSI